MEELFIHYWQRWLILKLCYLFYQQKNRKQNWTCDSPLKRLVNHQPDRHSTSPLVSLTRDQGKTRALLSFTAFLSGSRRVSSNSGGPTSCPTTRRSQALKEGGGSLEVCGGVRKGRRRRWGPFVSWTSLCAPVSGSEEFVCPNYL